MPARSKVLTLPAPLKEELDRRLVASGFGGYEDLSKWLAEKGQIIGKSTLHRYGEAFEERIQTLKLATEQAKAIVAESPDDEGSMNEALTRLVQERLFFVLRDLQIDPEQIDINKLGRTIAELGKASISQKRFAAEARKQAIADAAAKIDELAIGAKKKGLDPETLRRIREEVYGLAPA